MAFFLEKSGFLLTGCTSLSNRYMSPQIPDGPFLTHSASHIEHEQGRVERLATRLET